MDDSSTEDDLAGWRTSGARHCAAWMNLGIGIGLQSAWEYLRVGRKSRIWPGAMARAIKERDQHCVWPGCTQTHHLHIHHLKHWADGGDTVRKLLPEYYRFRVIDAQGQDIHNCSNGSLREDSAQSTFGRDDYTRVGCGEPVPGYYYGKDKGKGKHALSFTSEAPAHYAINDRSMPKPYIIDDRCA